jgi:hypothetical protein
MGIGSVRPDLNLGARAGFCNFADNVSKKEQHFS